MRVLFLMFGITMIILVIGANLIFGGSQMTIKLRETRLSKMTLLIKPIIVMEEYGIIWAIRLICVIVIGAIIVLGDSRVIEVITFICIVWIGIVIGML